MCVCALLFCKARVPISSLMANADDECTTSLLLLASRHAGTFNHHQARAAEAMRRLDEAERAGAAVSDDLAAELRGAQEDLVAAKRELDAAKVKGDAS